MDKRPGYDGEKSPITFVRLCKDASVAENGWYPAGGYECFSGAETKNKIIEYQFIK
ncbi:hypothetical protein ACSS6W_000704 [Trichoderma asperelloides]